MHFKLLNFWSRSHCISNSITSTIKKRKLFAASRESYIFYESLWDEDYQKIGFEKYFGSYCSQGGDELQLFDE
jgi:hypothetical protein